MKKNVVLLILFGLLVADSMPAFGQGIIANHTCTDISMIPPDVIDSVKAHFKMTYGHTSHGSQIVSGMNVLQNFDELYDYFNDHNYYLSGSGSIAPEGDLSLWDQVPSGDLGNPDRFTWATRTEDMLNGVGYTIYPHGRNLVMWSWCGQVSWATYGDIDTAYLGQMNQLELDFPDVTFVYMTGHLDGSGEGGNLHQRNEQIRQFCIDNDKVLFDFADIESYDPDGNYFLDQGANDNCDYWGGNWADEWCAAHPDTNLCDYCSCAHSRPLNCNLKARAFWWMMARLEGWLGTPEDVVVTCDASDVIITWETVAGASSYKVYSSAEPYSGFTVDNSGVFDETSWTAPIPGEKLFYRVVAEGM